MPTRLHVSEGQMVGLGFEGLNIRLVGLHASNRFQLHISHPSLV